jgi:hypothetical protein
MTDNFDYYRLKTEWTGENEAGALVKKKTEELVYASSYSEAETMAYAIIENQQRAHFKGVGIEIIKTKISELVYNDNLKRDDSLIVGSVYNYFEEPDNTGMGLYAVKLVYIELDEKSGKEKRSNATIHIPASSNTEAARSIEAYLKRVGETRDFIVRDTKFDKAEAILWPVSVYKSLIDKTMDGQ